MVWADNTYEGGPDRNSLPVDDGPRITLMKYLDSVEPYGGACCKKDVASLAILHMPDPKNSDHTEAVYTLQDSSQS